jgi:hypothetical protein
MRPGQSNKRSRGRGRKGPSPLSRSYESNGPDVKIRGTAQHIADKYINLARDAQSSGDTVLSEAYFQHAEHYYRIVAAAQQQMNQPVIVKRADDPLDSEEGSDRDDDDSSDQDGNQSDASADDSSRDDNRRNRDDRNRDDDDGDDRRSRRNRGRQRRGRGEDGREEQRADGNRSDDQSQHDGDRDSGDANGYDGDERPRRAPRARKAKVDVADRFDDESSGNGTQPHAPDAQPANDAPQNPGPVSLGDDVAPVRAASDDS